jgi:gliding motility-associated protein GldL
MILSKKTMNLAYGLGASVVILGALFKLTHFEIGFLNGTVMLTLGLVSEALIFGISAFEKPEEELDWSRVYPQLKGGSAVEPETPEGLLSKRIDKLLSEAKVDADLMNRLSQSIQNFETLAKQIQPSVQALNQTESYTRELENTTSHLVKLQELYSSQVESSTIKASVEKQMAEQASILKSQTEQYSAEMSKATSQLKSLQELYALQVESNTIKANAEKSISEYSENLRIQSDKYASELATAATHLSSLKDLYSSQVESNSVKAIAEKEIMEQTTILKSQMVPLIENIKRLNEVYSGMLNAIKN